MVTLFSIPKPFTDHSAIIQRNALQSWLKLEPRCEIILCGDDEGVADAAAEFNVLYIPDVARNEYGTPLLSSAFRMVQHHAKNPLLCYVNADIILLNDLIRAISLVSFKQFLIVGQRWNMDINAPIDFLKPDWENHLRERVTREAQLQPPFGSDYFIFPKDVRWDFPEFAVGRPGWDNWIIYRARALQIPVIDSTSAMLAIHQNHNYAHIPSGFTPVSFEGPESVKNRNLMDGEEKSFNLRDVTHQIKEDAIQKAMDFPHLQYRLARQSILDAAARPLAKLRWRLLTALLYRREKFPDWFWQNLIYLLTK
jgi:hypothetical protein